MLIKTEIFWWYLDETHTFYDIDTTYLLYNLAYHNDDDSKITKVFYDICNMYS